MIEIISSVFIMGRSDEDKENKKNDNSTTENSTTECLDIKSSRSYVNNSTMVICCPNAGYYEYLYYEVTFSCFIQLQRMNGLTFSLRMD
jgi:hypothetical protein